MSLRGFCETQREFLRTLVQCMARKSQILLENVLKFTHAIFKSFETLPKGAHFIFHSLFNIN